MAAPARRPRPGYRGRAIFVDDTGRRTRWVAWVLRTVVLICLLGLGLVAVSLLGGVPLPGLAGPVRLPSNEAAHPRGPGHGLPTPSQLGSVGPGSGSTAAGAAPPLATGGAASSTPAGSQSATHTGSPTAAPSATPTPSSPRHTTPAAVATRTHPGRGSSERNTPTPHATKTRHGAGRTAATSP